MGQEFLGEAGALVGDSEEEGPVRVVLLLEGHVHGAAVGTERDGVDQEVVADPSERRDARRVTDAIVGVVVVVVDVVDRELDDDPRGAGCDAGAVDAVEEFSAEVGRGTRGCRRRADRGLVETGELEQGRREIGQTFQRRLRGDDLPFEGGGVAERPMGEFEAGRQGRDRGPEFVAGIRDDLPLVVSTRAQTTDEGVQGDGEVGELISGSGDGE
nr:hypothetical protein [Frondihabitans sucicola]